MTNLTTFSSNPQTSESLKFILAHRPYFNTSSLIRYLVAQEVLRVKAEASQGNLAAHNPPVMAPPMAPIAPTPIAPETRNPPQQQHFTSSLVDSYTEEQQAENRKNNLALLAEERRARTENDNSDQPQINARRFLTPDVTDVRAFSNFTKTSHK
jgi:hypothetical protein